MGLEDGGAGGVQCRFYGGSCGLSVSFCSVEERLRQK